MTKLRVNLGSKKDKLEKRNTPQPRLCEICDEPLYPPVVKTEQNNFFHLACIEGYLVERRCDICHLPLKGSYYYDAWKNFICHRHFAAKPDVCFSCARILHQGLDTFGVQYADGRKMCKYCLETAVNEVDQVDISIKRVLGELTKIGIHIDWNNILFFLCDADAINKMANVDPNDYWSIRGLMIKRINLDDQIFYEIQILNGLPKLDFEAVLAHELLHVWIDANILDIPEIDKEGICNLGAFLILRQDNSKHAIILLKQLDDDLTIKYGNSFRRMRKKLVKLGWNDFVGSLLGSGPKEEVTNEPEEDPSVLESSFPEAIPLPEAEDDLGTEQTLKESLT